MSHTMLSPVVASKPMNPAPWPRCVLVSTTLFQGVRQSSILCGAATLVNLSGGLAESVKTGTSRTERIPVLTQGATNRTMDY